MATLTCKQVINNAENVCAKGRTVEKQAEREKFKEARKNAIKTKFNESAENRKTSMMEILP